MEWANYACPTYGPLLRQHYVFIPPYFFYKKKISIFNSSRILSDVHFHATPRNDAKNASDAFESSQSAALSFHNNGLFLFSDTRFCHNVNSGGIHGIFMGSIHETDKLTLNALSRV